MNIFEGRGFRIMFFDTGRWQPPRLLLIFHHLTVDGISWRIILEDFMTLYRQFDRGREARLPEKTTSFLQWTQRLQDYAQSPEVLAELDYWLQMKDIAPATLPADNPEGSNTFGDAGYVTVSLDLDHSQRLLTELPARTGVKTNEALLAALVRLLGKYNQGPELLIEMRGHGREDIFPDLDISRTLGWFTSSFPVTLRVDNSADVADQVHIIRQQLNQLPNSGIGYGLLRYLTEDKTIRRQMQAIPKPEISFNYFGVFGQGRGSVRERVGRRSGRLSALMTQARKTITSVIPKRMRMAEESLGSEQDPLNTRASAISIITIISDGELNIRFVFSRKQYHKTTIRQWAEDYRAEIIETVDTLLASQSARALFQGSWWKE
jgi:non-ribosomal peptide synthase protein (TIGR01720 family)